MSSKKEKALFFRNSLRNYPDPSKYEELNEIGEGAFGVVKGVNRESGQVVAMKKLIVERNESCESVIMLMREIQILRSVKFENIINLYEVCTRKPSLENLSTEIYLILELCKQDLTSMLEIREVSRHEKKQILEQLFKGINYLHSNQIMHRDLKPDNILMTETGVLKIGDFGSAKKYDPEYNPLTFPYSVVSLWYRAPELLLRDPNYSPIIDLWAAGCIMAELWTRKVIMKGHDKLSQLIAILRLCGSITPEVWPGVDNLNLYREMDLPKYLPRQVKQLLQPLMMDYWACDLLDNLLVLNPQQRLNAGAALQHRFFNSENDDHVDSA